jgi:hypothetical protein
MLRLWSSRRHCPPWSQLLCLVLACLLPIQAAAVLAFQTRGPVHTHRAVAPIAHVEVDARDESGLTSWQPAAPLFRHRSAPDAPHDESHLGARHHHAVGDASVQLQPEAIDAQASADGSAHNTAAALAMAWATPCEGFRWQAMAGMAPQSGGCARWRDAVLSPLRRPPRLG